MTTKEINKQKSKNEQQKKFTDVAKVEGKSEVTNPSNVKKVGIAESVNTPLTPQKAKSRVNDFLKYEHNTLNNCLKTVAQAWDTNVLSDYIKTLKNVETDLSKNKVPIFLDKEDFEYQTVSRLIPFITDSNGKKIFCRVVKVNERNEALNSFGNYKTSSQGKVVENDKEVKVVFRVKNTDYTLKPITGFSFWYILSIVQASAKNGALKTARVERDNRKRELKLERDEKKQAEREAKEAKKQTKKEVAKVA